MLLQTAFEDYLVHAFLRVLFDRLQILCNKDNNKEEMALLS